MTDEVRAVIENSALALEESANLLRGHGLNGCANIMKMQADRCREIIAKEATP